MAHTHYHGNTQCNPAANPPFHNVSCNNRGAEIFCTLKETGDHAGKYMCRHQGQPPAGKVRREAKGKKIPSKKSSKKTTKKRKTVKK